MSEPIDVTVEDALRAVREAAFTCQPEPEDSTCGHTGCTDHPGQGRLIVHCFAGGLGADWDLASVENEIAQAQRIAWVDNVFGHELGVLNREGRVRNFNVRRPAGGAS